LFSRSDWDLFKETMTVGGIPGGTGNGLIKSFLDDINEEFGVEEAAWLIIRGRREKIDLT
jgi:hypothetical protein